MESPLTSAAEAAAIVQRGGVVVIPTETVYGLAAAPDGPGVERIFAAKQRPADKTLQLLIPDASWLDRLGRPTDAARALAAAFWPGPLTLVVHAGDDCPAAVCRDSTVGLRVPAHTLALEVLSLTGPLAASSANRSGDETPSTVHDIALVFGDLVDGYLDGGRIATDASTVVSVSPTGLEIVREGALPADAIRAAAEGRFEGA